MNAFSSDQPVTIVEGNDDSDFDDYAEYPDLTDAEGTDMEDFLSQASGADPDEDHPMEE